MERLNVCVLIPAFQEGGRIGSVVTQAKPFGNVIVVDDGSSDLTAEEAHKAGAVVIRHPKNLGKGSAVKTGIEAFLKGREEVVILLDGDGQHDPNEIPRFVQKALQTHAQMIIGNRMSHNSNMPLIRRATNWIMSKILSLCSGISIPDSQCGFRLIRREIVGRLSFNASRFDIESDILLQTATLTKEIENVYISTIYGTQKSKIHPVKDTIRFIRLMASYLKNRVKGMII